MASAKMTEIIQLETGKKWDYLKRYYEVASDFYQIRDRVVEESEISECVCKFKTKPSPQHRKEIKLKRWKFIPDHEDEGVAKGYFFEDCDESGWEDVSVPHAIQHTPEDPVVYGRTSYPVYTNRDNPRSDILRGDTHSWYKTRLSLERLKEDEAAYLHFENVNLESDVWVNEYPVMRGHVGLFPYNVEITEELDMPQVKSQVVAVRVSNIVSNIPHMFYNGLQFAYYWKKYKGNDGRFDWKDLACSGIGGDVRLSVVNKNHIENVFISTSSINGNRANLGIDIALRNQTVRQFDGKVEIELSLWSPAEGPVVHRTFAGAETLPLNDSKLHVDLELEDPRLWNVDSPFLYLAHFTLIDSEGRALDDLYETFGIRTIEMKNSHFYLNGKKIVLQGTHDVCNYEGEPVICPSDEIIVKDILMHKRIGANCSRWPSDIRLHYRKIAEYCDQMGYMLSWTGYLEIWTTHPESRMLMTRDVGETIRSLRNHPSIVMWEMGDEALMSVYEYRRMRHYEEMYDLVYREDPTRPIITSGSYCNELVDWIMDDKDEVSLAEKRRRILRGYPVYGREQAVWDLHYCPYFPPFQPVTETIERAASALAGARATVYTEFGCDALPNPDLVSDVYGGFHWHANAFISIDRHDLDMGQYGRDITQEDWKETQAFQAMAVGTIIDNLRQRPDECAAYYFVTMFDVWTFFWGASDVHGNCKLMYFTNRNRFDPLYISALHGNTEAKIGDGLAITASNYGDPVSDGTLKVVLRDRANSVVLDREYAGVSVKGSVAVTKIADVNLSGLEEGLYSVEYYLSDKDGCLLGKMLELAFLEK